LNLILPKHLIENIPNDKFVQLLSTNEKLPNFLWNESTRSELKQYILYEYNKMLTNFFELNIDLKKLNYSEYTNELMVDDIFIKLFILEENKNWVPKNPEKFGKEILYSLDVHFNEKDSIEKLILSFYYLISKPNLKYDFSTLSDSSEYIRILFKFLSNQNEQTKILLNLILICSKDSNFIRHLENLRILHFFTFLMKQENLLVDIMGILLVQSNSYVLSSELIE
jgi:hypothetical protein